MRVDPATGLKTFDTRPRRRRRRSSGPATPSPNDASLKVLPEQPAGAVFDAEEQAKYRAFKEARRGAADYMAMEGEFAKYLEDVYSAEPVPREALTDECEILVVGAGFAGLLLWHKLSEAGFVDVRFCEKGGDVGGTWYWNRYPGIACDVESYSYLPLLEEMGYFPTMKFASGFEIFEYCQKMAEKFGFYEHCLFHTTVERTEWDEASRPLDRVHRPRRRDAGALRDPRQRHPHHPEAGPHRRHGDVRGRVVPHVALELRRRPRGQARRHHRHRRHRRAGHPRAGQGGRRALRVPAHAVDHRRPRPARHDARRRSRRWANEPGWARARRARFAKISRAAPRSRPTTTTSPARSPTSRSASSTSAG